MNFNKHNKVFNKAAASRGTKYLIVYKFIERGVYIWAAIYDLQSFKRQYNYVIKSALNFKILYKKEGATKYSTLLNKSRLSELIAKEVTKKIIDSGQKSVINNNIRSFRDRITKGIL